MESLVSNFKGALTCAQAARQFPGSPAPSTVWRWARKGVKARNGERVRLRHVRIGGQLFIPVEALAEFAEAVADADRQHFERDPGTPTPTPRPRSDAQRQRAIEAARQRLREAGV